VRRASCVRTTQHAASALRSIPPAMRFPGPTSHRGTNWSPACATTRQHTTAKGTATSTPCSPRRLSKAAAGWLSKQVEITLHYLLGAILTEPLNTLESGMEKE
jgi:hypothetical protein